MADRASPQEVAAALYVSFGLLYRRVRQAPVQDELKMHEISLLARLDRAGTSTAGELARLEQITPQAAGLTLAALTERGLVERHLDPGDGRRLLISLTDAGRALLRVKGSARTGQLAKALSNHFSQADLDTLMAATGIIQRLAEVL